MKQRKRKRSVWVVLKCKVARSSKYSSCVRLRYRMQNVIFFLKITSYNKHLLHFFVLISFRVSPLPRKASCMFAIDVNINPDAGYGSQVHTENRVHCNFRVKNKVGYFISITRLHDYHIIFMCGEVALQATFPWKI